MADYLSKERTNYFQCTNPELLKEIIMKLEDIEIHEENGRFVLYGNNITEYWDDEKEETIDIVEELQALLPDGEILTIMHIGSEKYRYLNAYTLIVTNQQIETINLNEMMEKRIQEIQPHFHLRMTY